MKKILLTAFLFISLNSFSQITQGNWLVGGNAGFSSAKIDAISGGVEKINTLNISPNVGYFLLDKFAGGLKVSYVSISDITSYSNIKQQSFQLGPFGRYYFLNVDKRTNFFLEANYQYGIITNNTASNKSNQNTFSIYGGTSIFLNSSVAIEIAIGYAKKTSDGATSTSNSTLLSTIGFQIHLDK